MTRVAIVTLGCAKNAVDSESLAGILASHDKEVTDDPSDADVVLVNTCGFIDAARRETVEEVLELADLKRPGGVKGLVLSGCLVARAATELSASLPEVDAFVDFAAYPRVSEIVDQVVAGELDDRVHGAPGTRFDPAWWDADLASGPRVRFGSTPWAYLKIAEGCDRGCTFCAIPLMRGKFQSRPIDVIEEEARQLVSSGVSELSLVSQDSVRWGRDLGDVELCDLLRRLERVDGVRRIRLMYLHPQGVTERLVDAVLESDVVVSYFDLSLQHVAPAVLRGMGRWGSRDSFERLIDRIRTREPLAGIRSTFILGFPGETDEHAREVESFIDDSSLDWIGVFTYSREEGTRSYEMGEQVLQPVARERAERVSQAADGAMECRARTLVGMRLEVLVERLDVDKREWVGRSQREAPEVDGEVRFSSDARLRVGDYVSVRVTGNVGADLLAKHDSS